MSNKIKSETAAKYEAGPIDPIIFNMDDDAIIRIAKEIIKKRLTNSNESLQTPAASADYMQVLLGSYEHEVFGMLALDNRNRAIEYVELFRGTVDASGVYPREVVKEVLRLNANAVIFAHNHPSGSSEPSEADKRITTRLAEALKLIDVRVLDHIVIGDETYSFAEHGLI
jgi:DNA repair protein RadC